MKISNKIFNGESQIILAYASWGLLPIYWKLFSQYDSSVVMAHRLLWSAVFCVVVLSYKGELRSATRFLIEPKRLGLLFLSAILIGINWFSYIYALSNGYALDAALAYYICPLLSVAFGALFLGEKITKNHVLPLSLITAGVGVRVIESGVFPTLALIMGGSFAAYALNKKRIKIEATQGMYAETLLLAGPAAAYLLYNNSIQSLGISELLLFSTTGVITVLPLILFAAALKTVSMKFVGMAQYVSPTLMFLVAVTVYQEPISTEALLSFILIWGGIAFSVVGEMQASKRRRLELGPEPMLSNA